MLLLGVDGGATKTVAVVADESGRVLGSGRAGGSDLHGPDEELALDELARAIGLAVAAAGREPRDIGAAVLACCGADWPEDFDDIRSGVMRRVALGTEPEVVNDGFGTLRAGTPDGVGLAVALGTGLSVCAAGPTGRWHSSYWADDAGAVSLARASVRAAVRAELGLGSPTVLAAAVPAALGLSTAAMALHALTRRRGLPPAAHGRIAEAALRAASDGDEVAVDLVEDVVRVCAESAQLAVREAGLAPGSVPLVLAGGLFRGDPGILRGRLAARIPATEIVHPALEPVGGALLLAFDAAGIVPVRERLRATFPDGAWFDTRDDGSAPPSSGVPG